MQREIKFRGYDLELKQWHYGNYYFYTDTIYCIASEKDHEENEHHCILFDGFCDWNMPRPHYKAIVDGKSIGQRTGLRDKNGKEIYEGDIVKGFIPEMANEPERVGIIRWGLYGWIVDFKLPKYEAGIGKVGFCSFCNYEVVGNIYENPELLEVSDD